MRSVLLKQIMKTKRKIPSWLVTETRVLATTHSVVDAKQAQTHCWIHSLFNNESLPGPQWTLPKDSPGIYVWYNQCFQVHLLPEVHCCDLLVDEDEASPSAEPLNTRPLQQPSLRKRGAPMVVNILMQMVNFIVWHQSGANGICITSWTRQQQSTFFKRNSVAAFVYLC